MLSIFKRFGWVAPAAAPVVVVDDSTSKVEKVAQVPRIFTSTDEMTLSDASAEWASAITALHKAQDNFNNADNEYIDTAIVGLNIARMRADNAQTRLRQVLGVQEPREAKELAWLQTVATA